MGSAGTIARISPLRHDAFQPELAGVLEYKRAVCLFHVLIEPQAGSGAREHAGQRCPAHLERLPPQIIAVEFDQLERIEKHVCVMVPYRIRLKSAMPSDQCPRGHPQDRNGCTKSSTTPSRSSAARRIGGCASTVGHAMTSPTVSPSSSRRSHDYMRGPAFDGEAVACRDDGMADFNLIRYGTMTQTCFSMRSS